MNLNHVNLAVPDVAGAAAFFTEYFGLHLLKGKGQPGMISILEDDAGFVLVLSNFPQAAAFSYPADFQIGFYQETVEQVNALHERLRADGHVIELPPRTMWDTWRFYFRAFDTLRIEVACPLKEDAVGASAVRHLAADLAQATLTPEQTKTL